MTVRLITEPDDVQKWSYESETDCMTAVVRGLAEYLETAEILDQEQRRVVFSEVRTHKPDQEDLAGYPALAVYSSDEGSYGTDDAPLAPINTQELFKDGYSLQTNGIFTTRITVELYCTSIHERSCFVRELEDMYSPVDWRNGFVLELGHYFNARAKYRVLSVRYADDGSVNQQAQRNAVFSVTASVPYVVKRVFAKLDPRSSIEVSQ